MTQKIILPKLLTDNGFTEVEPGRYRGNMTTAIAETLWSVQVPPRVIAGTPQAAPNMAQAVSVGPAGLAKVKDGVSPVPVIVLKRTGNIINDGGLIPALVVAGVAAKPCQVDVVVEN